MKVKVLPRPGPSTVIAPPIRPTSRAAIVRPKPVPPYLARCRSVLLLELPKDPLLLVRRDADPGVAHREPDPFLAVRRGAVGEFHADDNFAPLGEFNGVADQVQEDLSQPGRVADQDVWHVRPHVVSQLEPLPVRPSGQGPQGVAEQGTERELGGVQVQLAGLDLGEIEQVVDYAEQIVGGGFGRRQALPLILGQRRVQGQLGHAEDGVHGGADLVAHVRQELVLGPAGRLRHILGVSHSASSRFRSEMSSTTAMVYAGDPAASRWSEVVRLVHTAEPSLRTYRFSNE